MGGGHGTRVEIELEVRAAGDHYKETFVSDIDGSVQYYAVSPGQIAGEEKPGLVLTLHGASVEASTKQLSDSGTRKDGTSHAVSTRYERASASVAHQ